MTQPRLLLLPGTQCNELLWQDLIPEISTRFTSKHWPIPNQDFETVLTQLHQDLITMIQAQSDRVIVFGFSLGGYIVARYLAEYGKSLDEWLLQHPLLTRPAFVICSHTPTALPKKELEQRKRILTVLEKNDYAGVSAERVCQLLGQAQHNNAHIISTVQIMDRALGKTNLMHQMSFTGARIDTLSSINQMSRPFEIDFVCTHKDPLVNYKWLHQLGEGVHLSLLGEAGHMLPLEYPKLLGKWLKDQFA